MKLPNNRLRVALVVGLACLLVGTSAAWWPTARLSGQQADDVAHRLTATLTRHRERVDNYFDQVARVLRLLADSRYLRDVAMEFTVSFEELGDGATRVLRRLYVHDNPNPPERRRALLSASDGSWYSQLHGMHHPWFRANLGVVDIDDLYVVSAAGDVVYSVGKDAMYGERLTSGNNGATPLADVFRELLIETNPEAIVVSDFDRAEEDNGRFAYLGTAVLSAGETVAVVVVKVHRRVLERLLAGGMANTTSYLFGSDGAVRAAHPVADAAPLDATLVDDALDGLSGVRHTVDGNGRRMVAAFGPLQWQEQRWAVLVATGQAELARERRRTLALSLALVLALSLGMAGIGYALAAPDDET